MPLPTSGFLGLAVAGSEVAGNNYARQAIDLTLAADGTYTTNSEPIVWDVAAPIGWGLISGVLLFNDASEQISLGVPVITVTVDAYESVRIRPGGLVLTLGPPIGTPYGMRKYGRGRYATEPSILTWVELLEIGFDRFDPCKPGVWEPAEACQAAAWEPVDLCQPGTWWPAQKPLRRAA